MGIDAEMYARIKGKHLEDDEIRLLAYRLASTFGHEKFFIKKDADSWESLHHCLVRADHMEQDSAENSEIPAEAGETLLYVHLWSRYYGEGYERGDFPLIYFVAEWLEANTGGEVWYGGDSSGVLLRPFGCTERQTLLAHFLAWGHAPYRGYPGGDSLAEFRLSRSMPPMDGDFDEPPRCSFCGVKMVRFGWGQKYAAWGCSGCGETPRHAGRRKDLGAEARG